MPTEHPPAPTPRRRTALAVGTTALLALTALGLMPSGAADHGEGDPTCPSDLDATVIRQGIVLLDWEHALGSDASNVYRTVDEGEEEQIASIPSDEEAFFADEETVRGADHTYEVRAVFAEHGSKDCPTVTVHVPENPPPRAPDVDCPPDVELSATAHEDESITLRADGLDRSASLLRAEAGTDEFEQVRTLDEENNEHRDEDVQAGVAYEYQLVVGGNNTCATVEVTAIPVFTGALPVAAAMGVGLAGYAWIRRRA